MLIYRGVKMKQEENIEIKITKKLFDKLIYNQRSKETISDTISRMISVGGYPL
jgi:hypothetical protein